MPLSRRTALLLALPVLLTACSAEPPAPAAAPTPPASTQASPSPTPSPVDPRPRLALAARDLAKTSYKIDEVNGGQTNVWQVHGPSKSFRVIPSGAPGGTIQIGGDKWVTGVLAGRGSAIVPGGKTRWMKVPKSSLWPMPDVVAARLVTAATGLVESTPGVFTGSVPEKVCREVQLFSVDLEQLVLADPPTKAVKWAATGEITIRLDQQGRLAGLAVEVPSADGRTVKKVSRTYRDHGKGGRPGKPPAKDVLELPAFPN